jgi:hypothetical protein
MTKKIETKSAIINVGYLYKTTTKKQMAFPVIDAHFWVERDGEIIDPYFQDYDFVKMVNALTGDMIHLEAEPLIQEIMKKRFNKVLKDVFGASTTTTGEDYKQFVKFSEKHGKGKATVNQCFQNSVVEITKRGGTLKFGSMGWKRKAGGVHYEFGGEGWKIHQFLKM